MNNKELYDDAVGLLRELVQIPSFSRQEENTAALLASWLGEKLASDIIADAGRDTPVAIHRSGNNVWVCNRRFDPAKPTILLCSHHDTVRPNTGYTRDPFDGAVEGEGDGACLFGLGSNDAGASVVSLAAAFRHFYGRRDLKYNLLLALVAEEEISGPGGLRSILPEIGPIDFAIVGEPTGLALAIAEKGLLVLDCVAHGVGGHAARDEGDNAIYRAIDDIEWFRTFRFPKKSELFGEMKMSVTMISAGTQHNVVPAECRFTVDVRVTERYTNEEVIDIVREHVRSDVTPRSTHLRPSSIPADHLVVKAGRALGIATFGSPTTSDQVALDVPSVKIGPGESARSHSADEFVRLREIEQGIELYIKLLESILS